MIAAIVSAHALVTPEEVWASWTWDPIILAGLGVTGWLFGRGVRRLWRAGRGRGVGVRRAVTFYIGLAAVGIALLSPLDGLAETLFSAHMIQHLVLILVAAPLLIYGDPLPAMMLALPFRARRTLRSAGRSVIGRATAFFAFPAAALLLHVGALWAWHFPVLYEAAITHEWIHAAEHVSFLATALLFWSVVVPTGVRPRPGYGPRILFVFANLLQSGALGAIILFSATVLYPLHALGAAAWGVTALEDQQLAGAIMWIPAGIVYFIAMAGLFLRWMREMDRRTDAADSAGRELVHVDG
ncbi:MAG: cytochrome c oxidase assembly protein [Actinomycetota bacterium]